MTALRVMGVSLTSVQEIWLWFLLPAALRCVAYIVDLSFACGVVQLYFDQGDIKWGVSTLVIIYTPSLVYYVMTISRPSLWEEQGGKMRTFVWFLARLGQLFVFPAWAIYRYGKRIFWSVEALFQEGAAREQALDRATVPSRIELYLFLHAFLHATPQVVLQLVIILQQYGSTPERIPVDQVQILCVTSSLVILALTITSYQMFESQRVVGRQEPWIFPQPSLDMGETAQFYTQDSTAKLQGISSKEDEITPTPSITVIPPTATPSPKYVQPNNNNRSRKEYNHAISCPLMAPGEDSDNLSQCISLPDNLPPAPPIQLTVVISPATIELPKRRTKVKGLEQDDPLGMSIAFLWWFFFIVSRFLAIITFFHFYPVSAAVLTALHYIACTCFLLWISRFPSVYKVGQQLCLGIVYLFCIIEYKTKFNNVKVIYITYFLLVFIENTTASLIWWYTDDLWEGWWFKFIFALIFGSFVVSMLSMSLYLALLKPKITSYYVD